MLQDPVNEHRVLGDALRHQQDALLYPMPLQHSQAGHFLQGQRQDSGRERGRAEGNTGKAGLGACAPGAGTSSAIDLMLA